jgi:YjbE family integral membrane protein
MDGFIGALLGIVLIDLVLSGDNAIVIGMAVRNLPPRQKRVAILGGTAGAVALRVILTALAALLLRVPLLQAAGGLVLVWITYRLLRSSGQADGADHASDSFGQAIRMIILADVSMSIDNVLAVGAAAQGDLVLLLFGLSLSLAIIMAGGSLVATLLGKLPWLVYVGGGVLLILAGEMIAEDHFLAPYLGYAPWLPWAISAGLAALIAGLLLWARRGADRGTHSAAPPAAG